MTSKTPGVWLSDTTGQWRGYWREPRTGKQRSVSMKRVGNTTEAQRIKWQRDKFREIQAVRRAWSLSKTVPLSIGSATAQFFGTANHLRSNSLKVYQSAARHFERYLLEVCRVETTAEIRPEHLAGFRAHLAHKGSPATINAYVRFVAMLLNAWRRQRFVSVTRDEIYDSMPQRPVKLQDVRWLRTDELRKILSLPRSAFAKALVLTGCRVNELWNLRDEEFDAFGKALVLPGSRTKTGRGRTVDLSICPKVIPIIRDRRWGGSPSTQRRLLDDLQVLSDPWTWKDLRSTCATYLTNAGGIWGGASAFRSAKQLGHSVVVAERRYVGLVPGINMQATTLEEVMGIEDLL